MQHHHSQYSCDKSDIIKVIYNQPEMVGVKTLFCSHKGSKF